MKIKIVLKKGDKTCHFAFCVSIWLWFLARKGEFYERFIARTH
ncbi:hypothetical protein [Campylobacter troglodytis]|nr:hypothetical protein [Campylobacter troglodytis]